MKITEKEYWVLMANGWLTNWEQNPSYAWIVVGVWSLMMGGIIATAFVTMIKEDRERNEQDRIGGGDA